MEFPPLARVLEKIIFHCKIVTTFNLIPANLIQKNQKPIALIALVNWRLILKFSFLPSFLPSRAWTNAFTGAIRSGDTQIRVNQGLIKKMDVFQGGQPAGFNLECRNEIRAQIYAIDCQFEIRVDCKIDWSSVKGSL